MVEFGAEPDGRVQERLAELRRQMDAVREMRSVTSLSKRMSKRAPDPVIEREQVPVVEQAPEPAAEPDVPEAEAEKSGPVADFPTFEREPGREPEHLFVLPDLVFDPPSEDVKRVAIVKQQPKQAVKGRVVPLAAKPQPVRVVGRSLNAGVLPARVQPAEVTPQPQLRRVR